MSNAKQETIADIVAEMRSNEFDDPSFNVYSLVAARTLAIGWADRIEAAVNQPVTNCNRLGNAAAMREALEQFVEYSNLVCKMGMFNRDRLVSITKKACDAISVPARNCDVGTAEEQDARHSKWCRKYGIDRDIEVACAHQDMSCTLCALRWAQMPYEEGCEK